MCEPWKLQLSNLVLLPHLLDLLLTFIPLNLKTISKQKDKATSRPQTLSMFGMHAFS
ncbi:hypothetical protein Hanom_Chr09g00761991 [Helianthus anomalus]